MGFTQIRFYCFKKVSGRVLHIMTNKNAKGADVLRYFTTSDNMPIACGSFARLPDDNSTLAVSCDRWGSDNQLGRWGYSDAKTNRRLFRRPIIWEPTLLFNIIADYKYKCDDKSDSVTLGDTWKIFVR